MSVGVQGIYGLVPFTCSSAAVQTFRDVSVQHEARYAGHDVIGETPIPEYIGPGQIKISFNIQINSVYGLSPALIVGMLTEMQESGESYRLCLGPEYLGKFYLRSFTEDRKFFEGTGLVIGSDLSLNLEEDKGVSIVSSVLSAIKRVFRI